MDKAAFGCIVAVLTRVFLLQEAASSKIRIEPGHGTNRGRLQVFNDGIWGTVCNDNFGNFDARVACRALGIDSKYAVPWNFGPGSGPILLDDLRCDGSETSFDDCLHNGWGNHECEHIEDTGVVCTDDEVIITPTNVPITVPEGDQVNFTCVEHGNRGLPSEYLWSIGTRTMSRQSSVILTAERHMFNNGNLKCTVTSVIGSRFESATVSIDVQYPPPAFIETSLSVIEGNHTSICVDVVGNPSPTPAKWRKMGLTSQWHNSTCSIHEVDESDSGDYLVVMENTLVNNVINSTKTGTGVQVVNLMVMYGPKLSCKETYTVFENTTALMKCHVEAHPPATITWSRAGSSAAQQHSGCQYRIPTVQLSHRGDYICTASNTLADYMGRSHIKTDSCRIQLIVRSYEELKNQSLMIDTSSSLCFPIHKAYIVGGSLGAIILAFMVLSLVMIIRLQNLSTERISTKEADGKTTLSDGAYYLHGIHTDQNLLCLSTYANPHGNVEYPYMDMSGNDQRSHPNETVDDHREKPHYSEVETPMAAYDYENVQNRGLYWI
ncbi:uncharacterized protein LOC124143583 [Haliotis rufescens]|uniref:uncharacterized protein LOC124143583 n=1 Tax=Haliotis rufescens TaxID=6454 RepID=UPI001EAFF5E2|nr:uncharacterized protein LOC124143583 [Haliotis rufescens]